MDSIRKAPSLVDLCTKLAIENVRYIGNVSGLDYNMLERILPHCSVTQLTHIENCTEDRDLSPVTNKLWKKFYELQFGPDSLRIADERMKKNKVRFKWKQLYEAKTKERDEAQKRIGEKLKNRYAEATAQRQSKQIKMTSKLPPSGKRAFWGGGSSTSYKSPIMKKAKIEYLKSPEKINHSTIKRTTSVQRTNSSSSTSTSLTRSISAPKRPNNSSRINSANNPRPFGKR
ncbi:hypothetical protein LUZ60_003083 [Juncus effusus]|nr:hypothetical protein LUZ60_003083 [Juncus effusus]